MKKGDPKLRALLLASMCLGIFGVAESSKAVCSWNGNTGLAASCAMAEVAICVSDASSRTGDVVISLPACVQDWYSTLTVNMSSGFSSIDSLTIKGYGIAPSVGSSNETAINLNSTVGFNIMTETNKKFRITNLKLSGSAANYEGVINIRGTSRLALGGGWRIDHLNFDNVNPTANSLRAIYISGYTYGVIDHNSGGSGGQFAHISEPAGGNPSWSRMASFGTSEAVYFEDNNLFYGRGGGEALMMIGDGTNGARVVYRGNTLTDYYIGGHDLSTEGRAFHSFEIYDNDLNTTASYGSSIIDLRGGTGYVYDNRIHSTTDSPFYTPSAITMQNYRSQGSTWINVGNDTGCDNTAEKACLGTLVSPRSCLNDVDCGGEAGACRNIDLNSEGNGWPCGDQIGRSSNQSARPTLFWNNELKIQSGNSNPVTPGLVDVSAGYAIQSGRDYCNDSAAMPISCGGFATSYLAYTYPHPLVISGSDDTIPPSAPSGLTAS